MQHILIANGDSPTIQNYKSRFARCLTAAELQQLHFADTLMGLLAIAAEHANDDPDFLVVTGTRFQEPMIFGAQRVAEEIRRVCPSARLWLHSVLRFPDESHYEKAIHRSDGQSINVLIENVIVELRRQLSPNPL